MRGFLSVVKNNLLSFFILGTRLPDAQYRARKHIIFRQWSRANNLINRSHENHIVPWLTEYLSLEISTPVKILFDQWISSRQTQTIAQFIQHTVFCEELYVIIKHPFCHTWRCSPRDVTDLLDNDLRIIWLPSVWSCYQIFI